MSDWKSICQLSEIPVLGSRRVARTQGLPVALFRTADDQVFALLDRCAHRAGPLSQGIVFGASVACPLHNWVFTLADGQAQGADSGCVPKFACKVEGGAVYLDGSELATLAVDLPPPRSGPGAPTGAVGDETFEVQAPHTA